jgi:hypothetical protein
VSRGFLKFFKAYNRVSPGFRLFFACSHEQAKPLNSHFSETYNPTFASVFISQKNGKIFASSKMEPTREANSAHPTHCGFPKAPTPTENICGVALATTKTVEWGPQI